MDSQKNRQNIIDNLKEDTAFGQNIREADSTLNDSELESLHAQLGLGDSTAPSPNDSETEVLRKMGYVPTDPNILKEVLGDEYNTKGDGMSAYVSPVLTEAINESIDDDLRNTPTLPTEIESDSKKDIDTNHESPKSKRNRNRKRKNKPLLDTNLVQAPLEKRNFDLSNISIDIENIEIVEKSELEASSLLEFTINGRPTFQVIANQSGYVAHMESIRLTDINSITNSTGDAFSTKQRLYKVIYDKINTTSVGEVDYKTWLKITSFYDVQTLLYGIYQQTFPTDTPFEVTCRFCNRSTDIIVNNESLITIKDEEIYSKMEEIISSVTKPEELTNISLVNKFNRIILPESKAIINIQTPSLWDYLELISAVEPTILEENEDIIGTILFINKLLILDVAHFQETGNARYVEIKNKNEIADFISNMEITDSVKIGNAIGERSEKYNISYKIKSFKCNQCQEDIGEIPVNMEELLFTRILQM